MKHTYIVTFYAPNGSCDSDGDVYSKVGDALARAKEGMLSSPFFSGEQAAAYEITKYNGFLNSEGRLIARNQVG